MISHSRLYLLAAVVISISACGGSSGSSSSAGTGTSLESTVTISGTVNVLASDLSAKPQSSTRAINVGATSAFANALMKLYKIQPNGTETLLSSTTAGSDGSYSFSSVAPAAGGNGAATDFYYEVRATDGNNEVKAPVAPTANTVVTVSPESSLAADIIANVVDIPNSDSNPTMAPASIEATRELVTQNATGLSTSITLPSAASASTSAVVAMANGIASAGGNAEKMYKALQFESEAIWLTTDTNAATTSQAAAYIKRLIREACNQPADNPVTMSVANTMATALLAGTTYTPLQIVTAYNSVSNNPADAATVLTQFITLLTGVATNLDAGADTASDFSAEDQIALYAKRSLDATSLTTNSALSADQALAFLFALPGTGNICQFANIDITSIIAALTSDSALATAQISDRQIYHDSGFGCDQNAGKGHFRADVGLFTPTGVTVNSVTITSSDTTALGGSGMVNLSQQGSRWLSSADGVCVTLGSSVTYTIAASFSNSTTDSDTVTRNHPLIPEAATTVNSVITSKNYYSPDIFTDKRPLYTWESPETKLALITDAPTGSKVKYTYEFSHIDVTDANNDQQPDNQVGPLSQCGSVNAAGSLVLYEVDNFIPTVDCDIAACAMATGIPATDLRCRMNIQVYLVDEADSILGQAAGHFPVFCVDTNNDGVCG